KHKSYSIIEITKHKYHRFARPDTGNKLQEKEETDLGGIIPVNIDGGLIAKGHPVGATGASQITALVRQLRGEAGDLQVDNAKVGLAQNIGGIGMYAAVTILRG